VIALKRGAADTPANMQWQTVDEAKAKDRVIDDLSADQSGVFLDHLGVAISW